MYKTVICNRSTVVTFIKPKQVCKLYKKVCKCADGMMLIHCRYLMFIGPCIIVIVEE